MLPWSSWFQYVIWDGLLYWCSLFANAFSSFGCVNSQVNTRWIVVWNALFAYYTNLAVKTKNNLKEPLDHLQMNFNCFETPFLLAGGCFFSNWTHLRDPPACWYPAPCTHSAASLSQFINPYPLLSKLQYHSIRISAYKSSIKVQFGYLIRSFALMLITWGRQSLRTPF